MRLSYNIMRASDDATETLVGNALTLAAAGRFGLLPGTRSFQLSLDIAPASVEVKALNCLAVTRGGFLIDVEVDTRFTDRHVSQISIPSSNGQNEYFLTINVCPGQWEQTTDGFEEPIYKYALVGTNSPIDDNALPIALIVNNEYGGWHIEEDSFVPPCLYVSSHQKYQNLLNQFIQIMAEVDAKMNRMPKELLGTAFSIFWPLMQQIMIDTDKGRDLLTPMTLLANVQKFIAAFTTACRVDKYLNFNDYDIFRHYILKPYNVKEVYTLINEGLNLCLDINRRIDVFATMEEKAPEPSTKVPAPSIANGQLTQNCSRNTIFVPIINTAQGAKVLFSTDGGASFKEATIKDNELVITIRNNFRPEKTPEPDQSVEVKLKAVLNGIESDITTFTLILHKESGKWIRI